MYSRFWCALDLIFHTSPTWNCSWVIQGFEFIAEHSFIFCSMWQSLQRCIDFTVPLYKWDKSYVQEHYQGALKIDPMVGHAAMLCACNVYMYVYMYMLCVYIHVHVHVC